MKKIALLALGLVLVLSLSVVFATEEESTVTTSAPETEVAENVEAVDSGELLDGEVTIEDIAALSGEDVAEEVSEEVVDAEPVADNGTVSSNNGSVVGAIIAVVIVIAVVAIAAILRKD